MLTRRKLFMASAALPLIGVKLQAKSVEPEAAKPVAKFSLNPNGEHIHGFDKDELFTWMRSTYWHNGRQWHSLQRKYATKGNGFQMEDSAGLDLMRYKADRLFERYVKGETL